MLLAIRSLSMTCHQSRPYSSSRWPAVSKHSSALANRFLWLEHVSSLSAAGSWGYSISKPRVALADLEVTVVEPDASRRRVALSMGANRALPPEADVGILRLMDFVMIGPGFPDVIRQSLRYIRDGGVALLFTPTATGVVTPLDLGELYFRDISLIPSYSCGPTDTREAYELLRQGRVRPEGIITHRFAIDRVQEAFDTARRGGAALKVLVTFPRNAGDEQQL